MKNRAPTIPEQRICKTPKEFLDSADADAAQEAASAFTTEILDHQKSLISEATVARESATLLLHVAQTLGRTTLGFLERTERTKALNEA